ncbi:MAG: phosphatidylserine decarboxylase [Phycisphaerae bacterium]
MMMARYARAEVAALLVGGAVATGGVALVFGWWALLPALLAAALLSFYRDPPRRIPARPDALLAPADGRIVAIERETPAGGAPQLRVVIFLSVFNVHVNRSPCAGRVAAINYQPGKFLNALDDRSNTENESNTLELAPRAPLPGPIRVRQIAGVLARRIVCVARVGDELTAGQRFGMIKLGSRTELSAPDDGRWRVDVRVGQAARGGVTVLLTRAEA